MEWFYGDGGPGEGIRGHVPRQTRSAVGERERKFRMWMSNHIRDGRPVGPLTKAALESKGEIGMVPTGSQWVIKPETPHEPGRVRMRPALPVNPQLAAMQPGSDLADRPQTFAGSQVGAPVNSASNSLPSLAEFDAGRPARPGESQLGVLAEAAARPGPQGGAPVNAASDLPSLNELAAGRPARDGENQLSGLPTAPPQTSGTQQQPPSPRRGRR